MELRQRLRNADWDKLKTYDVYSKIQDDCVARSGSGGAVSVVTFFILSVLFLSELFTYLSVEVVDHVMVDTTLNQKLHIGLNITFPHLRCTEVSVDTVDSTGDHQVNIQGGLSKIPLNADGSISQGAFVPESGHCYSCYEGKTAARQCCNTCEDLRDAYRAVGKSYEFIEYDAVQCNQNVGCEVHGDVKVSKVGGNVHVALGHSRIKDGKHLHEFNLNDATEGFNTSHTINRLDFGGVVPGVDSPLAGTTKVVKQGSFMFHYYVKLVPTTFVSLSGERTATHQYSIPETFYCLGQLLYASCRRRLCL